jgi:hypothetical protein
VKTTAIVIASHPSRQNSPRMSGAFSARRRTGFRWSRGHGRRERDQAQRVEDRPEVHDARDGREQDPHRGKGIPGRLVKDAGVLPGHERSEIQEGVDADQAHPAESDEEDQRHQ